MTRSEAPSLLRCLRRCHFGDQCMPAPDEASSPLGQGDDLAAATASDLTPENRTRHRVRESVQVRVKGERLEQAEVLRG